MQDLNEARQKEIDAAKLKANLSRIKNTILVMSGKGGVGKSTVSANLATGLVKRGYTVGVIDGDIHGPNMPKVLGVEDNELMVDEDRNIVPIESMGGKLKVVSVSFMLESQDTPVVWRGPVKHQIMNQFVKDVSWGDLDFLVVDLPPGTGDEPLSIAQIILSTEGVHRPSAIVVTTPQDVALLDSRKSVEFAGKLEINLLGIVENMSGFTCPHCNNNIDLFKTGGGSRAASDLNVPFLGAIPIDHQVVIDTDAGRPFMAEDNDRLVTKAFDSVLDGILQEIEG